jgi:hypothetical protein
MNNIQPVARPSRPPAESQADFTTTRTGGERRPYTPTHATLAAAEADARRAAEDGRDAPGCAGPWSGG